MLPASKDSPSQVQRSCKWHTRNSITDSTCTGDCTVETVKRDLTASLCEPLPLTIDRRGSRRSHFQFCVEHTFALHHGVTCDVDCQGLAELNSVFDQYRTCTKCDEIRTKQGRTQSTNTAPHTASHDQSGYMQSVIPGASGPFSETSAAAGRTFPPCLTQYTRRPHSSKCRWSSTHHRSKSSTQPHKCKPGGTCEATYIMAAYEALAAKNAGLIPHPGRRPHFLSCPFHFNSRQRSLCASTECGYRIRLNALHGRRVDRMDSNLGRANAG